MSGPRRGAEAELLHILEAFKRRTFITHFSFARVGPELICENKLSSQMSSVFFPKGCCQVKWETTGGIGDVAVPEERNSICTRMFGHMECQSGANKAAEVVNGQEEVGGRGAFSASSATALNIICYAILRTATSATNCPIGCWPEQQY